MNKSDRSIVLGLRFSDREIHSRTRKKSGYNVFVGWFYSDFKQLDTSEKEGMLVEHGVCDTECFNVDPEYADVCSVPEITSVQMSRLCGKYWRGMAHSAKSAWNERAELVNSLPVVGRFEFVPEHLQPNLDEIVVRSLTVEFARFSNVIKKATRYKSLMVENKTVKQFGNERFELGLQVFRSIFISHLLICTFFGTNYCSLKPYEIVYRKDVVVLHVLSSSRLRELFTMNNVFPFEYVGGTDRYVVAGKVYLVHKDTGKECLGCVIDDNECTMNVTLESGINLKVPRPVFSNKDRSWHLPHNDEYKVVQVDPIRIKILQSGNLHLTINRFLSVVGNNQFTNNKLISV